jgi:hypothetical protein
MDGETHAALLRDPVGEGARAAAACADRFEGTGVGHDKRHASYYFEVRDPRLLALMSPPRTEPFKVYALSAEVARRYVDGWIALHLGKYAVAYRGYAYGPMNALLLSAMLHFLGDDPTIFALNVLLTMELVNSKPK